MFKRTLIDRVRDFLTSQPDKRFTAREIAQKIISEDPEWADRKAGNSQQRVISEGDRSALLQQVVAEIGANNIRLQELSNLRMTEGRPRKYYYTVNSPDTELQFSEQATDQRDNQSQARHSEITEYTEESLYPLVAKYLAHTHAIYSKRIDEKYSSNTQGPGGNKWLFPDMIAFEILSRTWTDTVIELSAMQYDKSTHLWSLEVKKLINRANVREVFFQAVSNSSWANFAYLVASEISGRGTLDELRVLSNQHGVGVIQVSRDDPSESVILIPAREKTDVDWAAASRLAEQNSDARKVFDHVKFFYQTKNEQVHFWDEIVP